MRMVLPNFVSTAGASRLRKVLEDDPGVADQLDERMCDIDVDADVASERRVGVARRREAEEAVVGGDAVAVEQLRQVPVERRREQPVHSDSNILD